MCSHRITDEQIAVAVEMANSHLNSKLSPRGKERGEYMWAILNRLNIFRCERCDQLSRPRRPDEDKILDHGPDCNGKGYEVRK